jgi:hypothetical protein
MTQNEEQRFVPDIAVMTISGLSGKQDIGVVTNGEQVRR